MRPTRIFLFAYICAATVLPAPAQVVISQVYGGGGNTGAPYTHDFIELFNRGAAPVALNGWSVQYAATTGSNWSKTDLTGVTLQPGQYYLVQENAGAGSGVALPTPDATGTISMAAGVGKVVLVNNNTLITAGTSCPTGATVVDLVGYGPGTNCSETSPTTPNLTNTTAAFRAIGGCTDNGNNGADFSNAAPNPRNTSSGFNVCGGGGNPTISITNVSANETNGGLTDFVFTVNLSSPAGASGVSFVVNTADVPGGAVAGTDYVAVVNQSGSIPTGTSSTTITVQVIGDVAVENNETFQVILSGVTNAAPGSVTGTGTILNDDFAPSCTPTKTISQVQGAGHTSAEVGNIVSTSGVVTARTSNGFFMQEKALNLSSSSSQGLFVFTSSAPSANATVANEVCVTATVAEFKRSTDPSPFSVTELTSPTAIDIIATGQTLPAPVDLTASNFSNAGVLGQLERYEGMRVRMASARVTGPTAQFGEAYITLPDFFRPFREAGLISYSTPVPPDSFCPQTSQQSPMQPGCVPKWDGSPEVIVLDTDGLAGIASRSYLAGDSLSEVAGPLHYDFSAYRILPETQPPVLTPPVVTPLPAVASDRLTVATFNVEHFYDTSAPQSLTVTEYNTKRAKLVAAIKDVLRNPDIIGVAEFETLAVLQDVASAMNTANSGMTNYQAHLSEGNDVGGIDVGFLVNTNRVSGVTVTQFNKAGTFLCAGVSNTLHDRPPLVLQGAVSAGGGAVGLPITVIMNHTRSLLDIDSTENAGSGCPGQTTGSRVRLKRARQAEDIATLAQSYQALGHRVMVMGDLNAYQFNDGLVDVVGTIRGNPAPDSEVAQETASGLVNPILTNLVEAVPAASRYSYIFQGSSQVIDHLLISSKLAIRSPVFEFAHLDADYPETLRADATTARRLSDHDAGRASFQLPSAKLVSGVTITRIGMLYDRRLGKWRGTFRIANNSGQTLASSPGSPLYLVFQNLTPGVTVDGAAGKTDLLMGNSPYVEIPGTIHNHAQAVITVMFNASQSTQLQFQEQVYQGLF